MSHLEMSFLGGFEAKLDGRPITTFGTDKVRALLAFLVVESVRPHRRSELAAIFWPESPDKKAADNLSQTLLRLRRALDEGDAPAQAGQQPFLLLDAQNVQFNPLSDHFLDVAGFLELIRAYREHRHERAEGCRTCLGWLRQAADLYRGDLLAGFGLRDSVPFEEWQLVHQEALHGQAVEALALLMEHHEHRGEPGQVLAYARRLVTLEPWHERGQMHLMAALAQGGQEAAALEQYANYSRMLAEEFGLMPSAEAAALYKQIQTRGPGSRSEEIAGRPAGRGSVTTVRAAQGERRQVTALVCRPQALPGTVDPEDLQEYMARCDENCAEALERYGGVRQQCQGTECLIYFGYPMAEEDAARRAVYAALAIVAATRGSGQVRIGVHTGVMVSSGSALVGNVPDLARECERLAEPDSVILTADTERLVHGSFNCQPVGISGSAQQVLLYEVAGASTVQDRVALPALPQRLTRLAGREQELGQLAACLEAAQAGRGQVVTLQGEPGIGKSRLLWELRQKQQDPVTWLEGRCLPYFQNTSLYPIISLLEGLLGFEAGDGPEIKRAKLARVLARCDLAQPATQWLLELLLELPVGAPAAQAITAQQRERMRQVCLTLLQREAARQPLVVVIEDLHWSDPTTIEWLSLSLDALAAARCLVLLTWRRTFVSPWLPRPHLHQMELGPLNPAQTESMVADVVGGEALRDDIRRQIVRQTDGVPLFVEELTRSVLELPATAVSEPATSLHVPATLRDSLTARLDRTGLARETAEWAAALGREFSYAVLRAAVPFDERRLQADLAALLDAGLINAGDRTVVQASFSFKHALIQEAALGSLLRRTRQDYHRRIAETLAANFPDIVESQPEILAEHYNQAGLPAQAADHWLRAGERATTRGATLEARAFFDRALAAIEPADHERRWAALLGREAVLNLRVERTAQREDVAALLATADALDDNTRRAVALLRQSVYATLMKDFQLMLRASEGALTAAGLAGNRTLAVQALASKAQALTRLEDWAGACETAEETLARLPEVQDEGIRSYVLAGVAFYYAMVGDFSRALLLTLQSRDLARRIGDRYRVVRSNVNAGRLFTQLGHYTEGRAALEEGLALAEAIGDQRSQTSFRFDLSYALWCGGDLDRARAMGERALLDLRTTPDRPIDLGFCLAYLGFMLEDTGDQPTAAAYLTEARITYANIGMIGFSMEAQAVEARCMLALGRREEAQRLAEIVWTYLCEHGSEGIDYASRTYMCLADVFCAVEMPGISVREVIQAGYEDLMRRAAKISDPDWRRSFLENELTNKALVVRWAG